MNLLKHVIIWNSSWQKMSPEEYLSVFTLRADNTACACLIQVFLHFKNIIELDRDEEKDENEVKRAAMKIFKTQKLVTFFLTCLLPTSKLKLIVLLQKNASCWAFLCLFISFMPWNSFIRSDFLFETIIVLGILNVTQYRFIYMLVTRLLESRGYELRLWF